MKKALVVCSVVLLLGATVAVNARQQRVADSAAASDWPRWRGPDGTGVARGATLPTTWDGSENIAWKAELRGLGVFADRRLGSSLRYLPDWPGRAATRHAPDAGARSWSR